MSTLIRALRIAGCIAYLDGPHVDRDALRLFRHPRRTAHRDVATGTQAAELVGHASRVYCAEFSPDGRRIATGANDGSVRIWDAATFDLVGRLAGHESYVHSVAWRADSQMLISGSGDHTVRIWDTQPLKDRMAAREERQAIIAKFEPQVAQWFKELGEPSRVVERVKAEASLSARDRQVALQVVLRMSLQRQAAAARP